MVFYSFLLFILVLSLLLFPNFRFDSILFIFSDIISEHPNLVVLVFIKIKPILPPKPYLQQIVIKALFRNSNLVSRLLKRIPLQLSILSDPSVILSPFHNFINNVANSPLLGSPAFVEVVALLELFLVDSFLIDLLGHEFMDQ